MGGQAQVAERLADDVCNMSALPPVADITSLKGMSALCQKRTLLVLFDHLVGARKQRGRHREAERFCGLEVDHEIKSGWLFYWQVSGLAAL